MIDENMLKLAEIRNSYSLKNYGYLNFHECALLKYDELCLDIIKENQELKKQLEELDFIVGLRQKRNLIHKFDKEYDEEDKKKNPNRDYVGIMPDAEEVYKRYYAMKKQQKEFIEWLEDGIRTLEMLDETFTLKNYKNEIRIYKEILSKYKEIVGVKDE